MVTGAFDVVAEEVILGVSDAILVLIVDVEDFEVVGIVCIVLELVEVAVVFEVSDDKLVLLVDDLDVVGVLCVVFELVVTEVGVGFGVVAVVFGVVVACATVVFVVFVVLGVAFVVTLGDFGFAFAASSTSRLSRFFENFGAWGYKSLLIVYVSPLSNAELPP